MPQSQELDIRGPVHLIDHGGEGRPILLVHGLGGSHVNWSAVAAPLTELGSVRAIDLIGFGRTPPAGRSCAVDSQRDLVIDYLRAHADAPAVLVGNSMGGLISMRVASVAPELVHSLVLVDPALPVVKLRFDRDVFRMLALPLVPGVGPRASQRRYEQAVEDPEAFLDALYDMVTADRSRLRPEDRAQALEMMHERFSMPWAGDALAEAGRSIFRLTARRSAFAEWVNAIEKPAVVIHGDQDRLVDLSAAQWLVEQQPRWHLEVLPGIGHVPQLEDPDRFVEIMRSWLADQPTEASSH